MEHVRIECERSATVVSARGELDAFVAPELAAALGGADEDDGERLIVVDLSEVKFMDSTALGVLVRGVRTLEQRGARIRVVLPGQDARRIFEITTLDRVLPVSDSRAEALRQLAAGA
jgi:anti-sigma B factor antagonist